MGMFDGILLCSDFDGTMAISAKVSQENADAIRYFQENGGWFCPTSGRRPDFFHQFSDQFRPNCPVITLNGAVISLYGEKDEEDEILYCGVLDHETVKPVVLDMLRQEGVTTACLHYMDELRVISVSSENPEAEFEGFHHGLQKVVFGHHREYADQLKAYLRERYGHLYAIGSSWAKGIEIQNFADTKGSSALRLKEMLGAHTLVSVGDYENDLSMVEMADIGYAVGDAIDLLRAAADRVTVNCADHALAAIVRDLENDVKSRG